MPARKLTGLIAAFALSAAIPATAAADTLFGTIVDRDGNNIGSVTIRQTASGMLHLLAGAGNIPQGPHGFHIHETGKCDPQDGFKSAGGHLAGDKSHGAEHADGPHPGDFPNVTVGANNRLVAEFFSNRLSIDDGPGALLDEDGSALVIHAEADDYESQPSGAAGERIACAVLESQR